MNAAYKLIAAGLVFVIGATLATLPIMLVGTYYVYKFLRDTLRAN